MIHTRLDFNEFDETSEDGIVEATLRHALSHRQVVFSDTRGFGRKITEHYNQYGVTSGAAKDRRKKVGWQPAGRNQPGKPVTFWGSVGDERCHATSTRSGSAAVWFRNWHAGPLGHETQADLFAIRWLDLVIEACSLLLRGKPNKPLKLPAPQVNIDALSLWGAVCITNQGPLFNTSAYGPLQIKWGSTISNSNIARCKPPGGGPCVTEVSRSAEVCQHYDTRGATLQPGQTIIDPTNNVQVTWLCLSHLSLTPVIITRFAASSIMNS